MIGGCRRKAAEAVKFFLNQRYNRLPTAPAQTKKNKIQQKTREKKQSKNEQQHDSKDSTSASSNEAEKDEDGRT